MSSHPQDSQPPEDSHSAAHKPADDQDFWDLDSFSTDSDTDTPLDDLNNVTGSRSKTNNTSTNPAYASTATVSVSTGKATSPLGRKTSKVEQAKTVSQAIKTKQTNSPQTKSPKTPLETITSLLCYIAIIGLLTYLGFYVSKQHDFSPSKAYAVDTSATGEYASIAKIETWWEKPTTNKARYGVTLVPVATITLGDDSKSGVLRSFFMSSENELRNIIPTRKGDAVSTEFRDGKFIETGTNQITIYATDGFEERSHFMYYRSQDDERWTIEIRESSTDQATSNQFNYLAKAPIEPITK